MSMSMSMSSSDFDPSNGDIREDVVLRARMPFDRLRFPTLALYLDRVGGLDALPQCQSKASVLREVLREHPLSPSVAASLPPALAAFAQAPPPMNVWVSGVLTEAGRCAVYDATFKSPDEARVANINISLRLFQLPMYRALMVVLTPSVLMRAAGGRWAAFHRGSTLTIRESTAHSATAVLQFPPHLFVRENPMDVSCGLEAALIAAGGKDVRVVLDDDTPTSLVYRATF
jgi:hypothetical protein